MNRLTLTIAVVSLSILAAPLRAETLWATNPEIPTFFNSGLTGQSVRTPGSDLEVADDFNLHGVIEQILADGNDCPGCFSAQPVTGVFVRFYQWTATGPGALQSEQFLAHDDPRFVWTPGSGPEYLQITLPQPFTATGWHYVSVQVAFSAQSSSTGQWYPYPVNWNATMGGGAFTRNNLAGGTWATIGPVVRDASFALIGTPGDTTPPMTILTATSHPIAPSSRLRINGDGFGAEQGTGQVFVGGAPAIVTQWTDTVIIAYVPETTPTGAAEISVTTDAGETDQLSVTVEPRTGDGRVRWRFAVDADYMWHRPGVDAAGNVYMNDVRGRLYKVNADGGLEWIIDALRGQVGLGVEGPVAVAADDTIVVAVNPLGPTTDLVAYGPDGALRWMFIEPDSMGVAAGPSIGPDGNVYVAFHDIDESSAGIVSFTPDGTMRWSNNGSPGLYEHGGIGVELVFGASQPGGPVDQVVLTVDRDDDPWLYAFDMDGGSQSWAVQRGVVADVFLQFQIQPEAGSGVVYMTEFIGLGGLGWALWAFDGDSGERLWLHDPDISGSASGPELGPDGTIYFSWDISRVGAVSPAGDPIWTHVDLTGVRSQPVVSPDNEVVMVAGGTFGVSGTFKCLDAATGEELWKHELADENGNIIPDVRPLITADSQVAYWPTVIVADPEAFQYSYLYATDVIDGPADVPGDVDGDGLVDVTDLVAIILAWGPCGAGPCTADLDGSGAVDVADLVLVVLNWS